MDKGLTRFMKGRLRIAAVMAVFLVAVAVPAMAFASYSNQYPAPDTTVTVQPAVVGATFAGTYSAVDLATAAITIDGVPQATSAQKQATAGSWSATEVGPDVNGHYNIVWTWTAGGAAGLVNVICSPTTLAAGSHAVIVTLDGETASWSFTKVDNPLPPVPPVPGDELCMDCHVDYDGVAGHNGGASCGSCHGTGLAFEPAHTYAIPAAEGAAGVDAVHDAIDKSDSSACTACHGTDYLAIDLVAGEHQGCSCHAYGEAGEPNECVDCHDGQYAPHGFADAPAHGEGWYAASGHNAAPYDNLGGKTKFDGTEGVTIFVEAERDFLPSMPATWVVEGVFGPAKAPTAWLGQPVYAGDVTTMTTTWELPTAQVFWAAGDPSAPASAITGLDWDTVVACEDCHTGLSASGPHGAAENWGLDPAYPGEYSMAVLTKHVTDNFNTPTVGDGFASGIAIRSDLSTASVLALRTDGSTGPQAVICAKCHDLENQVPLVAGGSITPTTPVVGSNTGHNSHHQDATDGSDQCVSCHIGVPHGWKVPRMLVNSAVAEAPYLDPKAVGTTRTQGGVQMYRWNGTYWVALPKPYATAASMTADPIGFAGYTNITGAYNREGMQSLSGVNDHFSIKNDTYQFPAAGLNTVNTDDMIYWSEPQCQACNDHGGEDGVRVIDSE